ncbi:MAG TPA: polysaccharide deacetylase family protein, partial [Chitinophagaceae bacterium]|nr:polysaccharide deacetylase family protein [Chitinophagaceae bacterium]
MIRWLKQIGLINRAHFLLAAGAALIALNVSGIFYPQVVPVVHAQQIDPLITAAKSFEAKEARKPLPPPNCAIEACLALTFDDGPDPATTPKILSALNKYRAKATFFVIGNKVAPNASLLQQIQLSGNEIGNHSWNHANFKKLTAQQMVDQVNQTQSALISIGVTPPKFFRPPYEAMNSLM